MPLVSIIVPAYNCENLIQPCLESIRIQSTVEIEIIVVDDGSLDNTATIALGLAEIDPRVRVLSIQNSGPSAARNVGLEVARGTYVTFVDADDHVSPDFVSSLVEHLEMGFQLAVCGYDVVMESQSHGERILPIGDHLTCRMEVCSAVPRLYFDKLLNYVWNKMYVLDVIKNEGIRFREDFRSGEDLVFNLQYILRVESLAVVKQANYTYVIGKPSSITNSYIPNFLDSRAEVFNQMLACISEAGRDPTSDADICKIAGILCIMTIANEIRRAPPLAFRLKLSRIADLYKRPEIHSMCAYMTSSATHNLVRHLVRRKMVIMTVAIFTTAIWARDHIRRLSMLKSS